MPESFLFQTTIDVDDKEYVDKAIEKADGAELQRHHLEGPCCTWSTLPARAAHRHPHARRRLSRRRSEPIARRWACPTTSCITPERMLFITDKESEIYRSPHWYRGAATQEELKKRRQAYLDRGLTIDRKMELQFKVQRCKECFKTMTFGLSAITFSAGSYSACPTFVIAMLLMLLISALLELIRMLGLANGKNLQPSTSSAMQQSEDVDINTPGSRHSSLLAIMSAGASRVMPEDELKAVVAQKMPAFLAGA